MSINLDGMVAEPVLLTGGRSYFQILLDARRLLSNHSSWTQGLFARDSNGQPVKPRDAGACCWCLLGAVAACSGDLGITPPPLLRFLEEMMHYIHGDTFPTLGEMNDYLSHELVLEFLDSCISRFTA